MKILLTGTPGTGKTSISKELSKLLKIKYFSVKKFIQKNPSVVLKVENNVKVIKPALKKALEKKLPDSYIIDTHLIEYAPKTDIIVILRCNPKILKKRLEKRNYSKEKIRENLEVEILDYFTQKASTDRVIEFDTSKKSAKQSAEKIQKKIQKKEYNKGKIKWDKKEYLII